MLSGIHRILNLLKLYIRHATWAKTTIKFLITKPVFSGLYAFIYVRKILKEISRSRFPSTLSIETTNACNAHCIMCPREKMTRPIGLMKQELFERIADEASGLGVKRIQLMHFGEPLMDNTLHSRIAYVKQKDIRTGIFTNAALLNKKCGEEIIMAGLDELCISFDAFNKSTYEKIRRGLDYDKVTANIENFLQSKRSLKASNPRVSIVLVASVENFEEVDKFKKKWDRVVDSVETSTVDNYAGSVDVLPPEDKRRFIEKQKKLFPCAQLWNHFVVLWDGRVARCCKDYNGALILGDTNKAKMLEIWRGEKARMIREAHLKGELNSLPLCSECTMHKIDHLFTWWGINR
jgi:MoaA/NifB/PqqE/SkfB family radical SAM enzyme